MKVFINRSDENYNEAVNSADYSQLYNFPVTVTAGKNKYVIDAGSRDNINVRVKRGGLVYIIAENSNLDYISLTLIDTKNKTINTHFEGNGSLSCNPFGLPKGKEIFDYSTAYQIRILSQWLCV